MWEIAGFLLSFAVLHTALSTPDSVSELKIFETNIHSGSAVIDVEWNFDNICESSLPSIM